VGGCEGDGAVDGEGKRPTGEEEEPKGGGRTWLRVAVLVVVPSVLWTSALAVPFLPLATATNQSLVATLVLTAEVMFWAALFVGGEVISRCRGFFDPRDWSRRSDR
jgi:hypothetical protein